MLCESADCMTRRSGTMNCLLFRDAQGGFPVVERDGGGDPREGVCSWCATAYPGDGDIALVARYHSRENFFKPFPGAQVDASRDFIKRLGACNEDAMNELVEMVDWRKVSGFDVRIPSPFSPHAVSGSFPASARIRDGGRERKLDGGAFWKARWPGGAPDMRHIWVRIGSCSGDDELFDEALVHESFVGDLAADAPGARESLISRMGWDAPDYGIVLQ